MNTIEELIEIQISEAVAHGEFDFKIEVKEIIKLIPYMATVARYVSARQWHRCEPGNMPEDTPQKVYEKFGWTSTSPCVVMDKYGNKSIDRRWFNGSRFRWSEEKYEIEYWMPIYELDKLNKNELY